MVWVNGTTVIFFQSLREGPEQWNNNVNPSKRQENKARQRARSPLMVRRKHPHTQQKHTKMRPFPHFIHYRPGCTYCSIGKANYDVCIFCYIHNPHYWTISLLCPPRMSNCVLSLMAVSVLSVISSTTCRECKTRCV